MKSPKKKKKILTMVEGINSIFQKLKLIFRVLTVSYARPHYSVKVILIVFQFSSVPQLCPTLCNPMDCSTPGLPVHHKLLELTQTHLHWVNDAIQPSHPLLSPSPLTFNLFQHQGLFKWVSSLHQVARVGEFQLQYQPLQWIFRTDFC